MNKSMPLFDENGVRIATAKVRSKTVTIIRENNNMQVTALDADLFWAIRPDCSVEQAAKDKRLAELEAKAAVVFNDDTDHVLEIGGKEVFRVADDATLFDVWRKRIANVETERDNIIADVQKRFDACHEALMKSGAYDPSPSDPPELLQCITMVVDAYLDEDYDDLRTKVKKTLAELETAKDMRKALVDEINEGFDKVASLKDKLDAMRARVFFALVDDGDDDE